eukprot:6202659-Pleurochrysis_carterae.AAC.2
MTPLESMNRIQTISCGIVKLCVSQPGSPRCRAVYKLSRALGVCKWSTSRSVELAQAFGFKSGIGATVDVCRSEERVLRGTGAAEPQPRLGSPKREPSEGRERVSATSSQRERGGFAREG